MPFNPDKLAKLQQKAASTVRTGGKGTVRRKVKKVRKNATHDDKRLKSTLQRLNVRDIPAIEEVNMFRSDSTVIHFTSPKVQASIAANTYVVTGNAENKKLQDLLPGIINQLGPDNLEDLKKIYTSFAQNEQLGGGAAAGGDSDDDVPELVDNFDAAADDANKGKGKAADDDDDEEEEEDDDDGDDDVPELVES